MGNYKIVSGEFVRVRMTSRFFLEKADAWRTETWDFVCCKPSVTFSLLTKRAHHLPAG